MLNVAKLVASSHRQPNNHPPVSARSIPHRDPFIAVVVEVR